MGAYAVSTRDLSIIVFTTILAFCALYAPQPLLPTLAEELGVGSTRISLLITLTLLPLGLAPLVYGFVLEAVPARTMLQLSTFGLALSEIPFLMAENFPPLAAARLVQGLLLPAMLTALMTYCSSMVAADRVRRVIGIYVASTILGGFLGRAASGVVADQFGWRAPFALWMLGLLMAAVLIGLLGRDTRVGFSRLKPRLIAEIWAKPVFRRGYLVIFLVFFVFASVLNLLPFRLKVLQPDASETAVAMLYLGYMVGSVIALNSTRLVDWFGGESRAILTGLACYAVGMALFAVPRPEYLYVSMFVFCAGMFLVHSVLSGYLNHLASERKGVVNGLYVSLYYSGGALGSILPAVLYRHFGWNVYLCALAMLLFVACIAALSLRRVLIDSVQM